MNIYNSSGAVVRELMSTAPRQAGNHTEYWDGLNSKGLGLPAGTYTWKLISTPGFGSEFIMNVGSNYPTGSDIAQQGPGSQGGANYVAVDSTGIYIGSKATEGVWEPLIQKLSPDGNTFIWSITRPVQHEGISSLAVHNGVVYAQRTDSAGVVAKYNATTGASVGTINVLWSGDAKPGFDNYRIDVYDGVLVVLYRNHDAVRWYDSATGVLLGTKTGISLARDLAVNSDGTVYVTTGSKVIKFSLSSQTSADFVTGLDVPTEISVSRGRNEVLFFEAGTGAQRIKRYDLAGTRLNTSRGRAGGRQDGLYTSDMQQAMYFITDLAADVGTSGSYFIAEPLMAPRRVAKFNYSGSTISLQLFGGQQWASNAFPDPDDSSVIWMESERGTLMRIQLNLATKTQTIHSTSLLSKINGIWTRGVDFMGFSGPENGFSEDLPPSIVL